MRALSSISPTYSGSLLSLISPINLDMPPSYLAWFHNTEPSPKIPACLIKGKGLWEEKQCRLCSFPQSMNMNEVRYEKVEQWCKRKLLCQPYQELRQLGVAAVQSWPLYKTNIWLLHHDSERNTCNIQMEEPQSGIREWWRVCSVEEPR